jgi:hypothetical protein
MNPGLIGGLGATELMLARDNETPARSGMVGSSSKLSTSSTSSATHASRSARR